MSMEKPLLAALIVLAIAASFALGYFLGCNDSPTPIIIEAERMGV